MVDRATFDRIEKRHGAYASWAVWAEADSKPKSNIGDLRVLDPDLNPALLKSLRTDVIMMGLVISRPVVLDPFRNFHDASPFGHDYKIRYAFAGTPYYGAYMTDFVKGVIMPDRDSLMRHLKDNPSVVPNSLEILLSEIDDLGSDGPVIVTFGGDTTQLVTENLPRGRYSRLIPVLSYGNYISKEKYRKAVLGKIGSIW